MTYILNTLISMLRNGVGLRDAAEALAQQYQVTAEAIYEEFEWAEYGIRPHGLLS